MTFKTPFKSAPTKHAPRLNLRHWGSGFNGQRTHAQPQTKVRDETGHEHASDSGQFTSGFGGGGGGGDGDGGAATAGDAAATSLDRHADKASGKAAQIAKLGLKLPGRALRAARKVGKTAMDGVEKRYGAKVKKAVAIGVMLSLPVPVPGASALVAAPIIAFAELYRQAFGAQGKSAAASGDGAEAIDEDGLKKLVADTLSELFEGKVPAGVDAEAAWKNAGSSAGTVGGGDEGGGKRWEPIRKDYPALRTKDHAVQAGQAPTFDPTALTAEAIISTSAVDRDNEIMVPRGCDLTAYARYAPWFLDHQGPTAGGAPLFPFPVGSGKERPLDPMCPPAVGITDDFIRAKCWFNQSTPEAIITYNLWSIGHMAATSVGFEMAHYEDLNGPEIEAQYGLKQVRRHNSWRLCEVSIVGLGANREALAEHASRGHVGNVQIPDSMKRWFNSFKVKTRFHRAYPSKKKAVVTTKVRDDSGHEHAADTGQFTGGFGGSGGGGSFDSQLAGLSGDDKINKFSDLAAGYSADGVDDRPDIALDEIATARQSLADHWGDTIAAAEKHLGATPEEMGTVRSAVEKAQKKIDAKADKTKELADAVVTINDEIEALESEEPEDSPDEPEEPEEIDEDNAKDLPGYAEQVGDEPEEPSLDEEDFETPEEYEQAVAAADAEYKVKADQWEKKRDGFVTAANEQRAAEYDKAVEEREAEVERIEKDDADREKAIEKLTDKRDKMQSKFEAARDDFTQSLDAAHDKVYEKFVDFELAYDSEERLPK